MLCSSDKTSLSDMTFVATLMNSGTTATVALLRDGIELVVASVGDSRALLCRKGKAMKLTIDHTPERKEEKERYLLARVVAFWGMASVRLCCCQVGPGKKTRAERNSPSWKKWHSPR